jgi:hypothetical protein
MQRNIDNNPEWEKHQPMKAVRNGTEELVGKDTESW